jgi:hypothetical protein
MHKAYPQIIAILLLFTITTGLQAAMMPAEDIESGNLQAPEIVNIVVQQVRVTDKNPLWQQVVISARITKVQKSASGLQPEQEIRLMFETPAADADIPSGYTGPSVPQAGAHLTAYLYKGDDGISYRPQALKPQDPQP